MNSDKAIVIANNTSEGISVIDISLYNESGRRYNQSTKRLIDSINSTLWLDKQKIKSVIAKQYGIPPDNITFE